ncbi:MAG: hypothetical protein QOJ62_3137 [Actinomycetota bacterium]|jgi:hypothetical protein|nr:hypothetical protein [Actinomycetota bacterium]
MMYSSVLPTRTHAELSALFSDEVGRAIPLRLGSETEAHALATGLWSRDR